MEQKYIFGENCAISPNVFLKRFLTIFFGRSIYVGDRVWIGAGAIILGGMKIESDSVVAAGAVVMKNVPSRCIVAGVPARVVKKIYRRRETYCESISRNCA